MLKPYIGVANRFRQLIKANGGLKGSFLAVFSSWSLHTFYSQFQSLLSSYSMRHRTTVGYRSDDLKMGELKGTDKFGNKYYQSNFYFFARNRWVEYGDQFGWDYNASQIPPEWHRWMHYMTDETPVEKPPTPRKWIVDHVQNKTGTNDIYVPYSTAKPRIESWKPPS